MSSNSILVVGGGFAGITAALEAAEVGYEVYIVEKNPYLGGRVSQLNQYFPKLCPPNCGLEIQFQRIKKNPKIKYFTMAEVASVTGTEGNYDVKVNLAPRYVNENCTACGACAEAADTVTECEFDLGLGMRKVAFRPNINSFPMRYVFEKDKVDAAEAQKVADSCQYAAIDLADKAKTVDLKVGAIVWATGWKPYDMANLTNLGGGKLKNVISNMQMERLAAPNGPTQGAVVRPSDGLAPKRVAFVQCAGSRDRNHLNYCSYICCMASLKQACYVAERYPDAKITIFYIDLRTPGRYDKFLQRVQANENVSFVKGKVAEISECRCGEVVCTVEDAVTGVKSQEKFDLVVLATGMQPSVAGQALPIKAPADEEGFVTAAAQGIIPAGCALVPLDVTRTAQSATGAALKAIQKVAGR